MIFLFELKMGHKAVETTCNINKAQELLMNMQYSGSLGSLVKEKRALKMRSAVAGHQKLKVTN